MGSMLQKSFLVAVFLFVATSKLSAEETNPILGKVGDFVLREADLDRIIASQSPNIQMRFQDDPQQRDNLVREILMKKAVVIKAKKDGFDKKPETKEQLGYAYDNFISQEYLVKVVTSNVTVPEEELKKYYQEHETDFMLPEQIKVRHIMISATKEATTGEREKAQFKAVTVLQRVNKGEDFAKLAAEFSDDQNSATKGGELAPFTLGKTNSEDFEKAAFALKIGEHSSVVTTPYGFHIIKLDERQEKRIAPFGDIRDFIHNKLKTDLEQKKAQEFVELAVKEARMEVYGEKPAVENTNFEKSQDTGNSHEMKK
jgi:peptidyl-prolyl cis-trans isomerase C